MQPEEDILELEEEKEIVVPVVGIFVDNTAILSTHENELLSRFNDFTLSPVKNSLYKF